VAAFCLLAAPAFAESRHACADVKQFRAAGVALEIEGLKQFRQLRRA